MVHYACGRKDLEGGCIGDILDRRRIRVIAEDYFGVHTFFIYTLDPNYGTEYVLNALHIIYLHFHARITYVCLFSLLLLHMDISCTTYW